jgi:hypothetical protein
MMSETKTNLPVFITSDWGKIFGFVWHNQGYCTPTGFSGYWDESTKRTWTIMPKGIFPFVRFDRVK